MARDLAHDVRRRAETVETDAFAVACEFQRPVADEPGAEERRRPRCVVARGERRAVALVGHDELRVAAVAVVAGEAGAIAEVLAAAQAVAAFATRPAEPGDADGVALGETLARSDSAADDLVTRHERQPGVRQLAVDDVEVGAAHAAGRDGDEDLALRRLGIGQLGLAERRARRVENHRTHG